RFVAGDFARVLAELGAEGLEADRIFFDLGVSSFQLDVAERGFSYAYDAPLEDRKSTRLNSSHEWISYAVFCLKKKKKKKRERRKGTKTNQRQPKKETNTNQRITNKHKQNQRT